MICLEEYCKCSGDGAVQQRSAAESQVAPGVWSVSSLVREALAADATGCHWMPLDGRNTGQGVSHGQGIGGRGSVRRAPRT